MHDVMIVEDNPTARDLIARSVAKAGYRCDKRCGTAESAIAELRSGCRPDIILLDVHLPGIDGIAAIPLIRELCPSAEIIIQTVFEDPETILRAIKAGVSGYLLKDAGLNELAQALQTVEKGGSPLSPIVARKVLRSFLSSGAIPNRSPIDARACPTLESLTKREGEILEKLIQGFSYREIGFELGISVHTVNSHLRKVYEKLRVNSRSEAVALATGRM